MSSWTRWAARGIPHGQWCKLHDIHQDDPRHDYTYPDCERHMREATVLESLRCWFRSRRSRSPFDPYDAEYRGP